MRFWRKHQDNADEREKINRLEDAEGRLEDLKGRANRAISTLDARHNRNHWQESVKQMIQGVI